MLSQLQKQRAIDMDELEELKNSFRLSMKDRHQVLQDLSGQLGNENGSAAACREIHFQAHKLAGSASLYGFVEVGELSQKLDLFLYPFREDFTQVSEDMTLEVKKMLTELLSAIGSQF